MSDRVPWPRATGLLFNLAATVLIIAGLRASADLIVPFLLALFLAVIVSPSINDLARWGLPRWMAVGLVTLGVTVICLLGLAYVGVSLNELLWRLPEIQRQLNSTRDAFFEWLRGLGVPVPSERSEAVVFDPAYGVRMLGGLLSGLSNIFSNGLLILITVAFILLESTGFPAKLRAIVGPDSQTMARILKILADQRRYMVIKTWISIATGVPVAIGLAAMGVDYAALWGVLAFLLNYVPTIGSLIAAIPPIMVALVQDGLGIAIGVAVLFLAVNFVIGYLVEPPAMGRGLGLSTLVVWVSLVFWGWVLGPVGMFLSVPLTMAFKIMLEGSDETRWLAILLGHSAAAEPGAGAGGPGDPPPPPG
ncbi:AI-2E family transporter [Tautonia plasticadhaerens]|uniref:AI-2 transport protein TqsA n=1 Tax=Tautonia plasticadhaerens TaxID=2527974 RepID=A0A518GVW6_9BACT|nr:AI-2E family transporter [Tautonia plasticadhaerens]QDV32742.1 AI-2 transport protein TqsA [Tautonia plasticadhaerens]